jgi:hypothetical protein
MPAAGALPFFRNGLRCDQGAGNKLPPPQDTATFSSDEIAYEAADDDTEPHHYERGHGAEFARFNEPAGLTTPSVPGGVKGKVSCR